jgi:outer membrane protein assembly factor BamD (BamD/ComL family)
MLGGFYERVANFEKASSYYEQYATKYPKDEKAADSLFNAALWQEGMGNSRRAVELYQAYIKSYREKPDVPDVWYTIALIYEREKNWDKAAETFDEYQKQFGKVVKPWKALHARYKWAMARRALDKVTDSRKAMEEIVAKYPSLPDADKKEPLMMDAAAHCRFQLMELDWQDYLKMKMDNVRYFRDDFAKKKNVSEKIIAAYAEIIKYGSPDWAIASLTRIGLAYKNFAKTIGDSPRPKGLDDEQLEMYESELQNRAFPLEEKAVEAFEKALEKSFELNIYNEWTLTAENMLAEFKPDAFGEVKQVPFVGSEFFIRAGLTTPAPPVAAGGAAGAGGGGQ